MTNHSTATKPVVQPLKYHGGWDVEIIEIDATYEFKIWHPRPAAALGNGRTREAREQWSACYGIRVDGPEGCGAEDVGSNFAKADTLKEALTECYADHPNRKMAEAVRQAFFRVAFAAGAERIG